MATVTLTKDNFEEVLSNNSIVLIDFWAPWCGPCKTFSPVFESSSDKHDDIVHGKVNTDEEQELAALFRIRSIPTLVAFRDQIGVFAQPGALPGSALESVIEQVKQLDMDQVREEIAKQEQKGDASA